MLMKRDLERIRMTSIFYLRSINMISSTVRLIGRACSEVVGSALCTLPIMGKAKKTALKKRPSKPYSKPCVLKC